MWFAIGALLLLAAIMVAAMVGDVRRKAKLRRMTETSLGRSRPMDERPWTEQASRDSWQLGHQASIMGQAQGQGPGA